MSAASYSLLGVHIHPLSAAALTKAVVESVQSRHLRIIAYHNLHSVYLHRCDEGFRAFYRHAHLCFIDGMSLVLVARLLGLPVRRKHRVTYVDWIDPLLTAAADRRWKVMYVGSRRGIAQQGAVALRKRHPGLVMETMHGFFDRTADGEANHRVVARIRAFEPQILMVGMGMPIQEHWILQNLSRLPPCVVLTAGAAIDYAAGVVPTPPRWAGRCGLEWSFRLFSEPRRLWRRYLVEPWLLVGLLMRELMRRSGQPDPGRGGMG